MINLHLFCDNFSNNLKIHTLMIYWHGDLNLFFLLLLQKHPYIRRVVKIVVEKIMFKYNFSKYKFVVIMVIKTSNIVRVFPAKKSIVRF
jgi:hypothetical protein